MLLIVSKVRSGSHQMFQFNDAIQQNKYENNKKKDFVTPFK